MTKKEMIEDLKARNAKLKKEVESAEKGAREISALLDAVLCETAFAYGEERADGKGNELIIPLPDLKNCREKYILSAEKTEDNKLKLKAARKAQIK